MSTTMNVHRVVRITVERVLFGSFVDQRYEFTTDEGYTFQISALSDKQITVEDIGSRYAGPKLEAVEAGLEAA